jgi:hypothetical protein
VQVLPSDRPITPIAADLDEGFDFRPMSFVFASGYTMPPVITPEFDRIPVVDNGRPPRALHFDPFA